MISSRAITGERLVNVLQSIALKQQTGRLSIEHGPEQRREKGEIFFAHGNTVFARTNHESGETALFTMLRWQEIQYAFIEGETTPDGVMHLRHRGLAPRADQSRRLLPIELEETRQTPAIGMPAIPKGIRSAAVTAPHFQGQGRRPNVAFSTGAVLSLQPLQLVPPAASSPALPRGERPGTYTIFRALPGISTPKVINQLERKERIVFLLLDGKRTLSTITHLVHRSEGEVAAIIVHLFRQGYIEYIQG